MYIFGQESLLDGMLADFNDICSSLGVRWWIIAAAALGFYRDGGYIPWDDDLDVGIICTNKEYIEIFERLFGSYGFEMLYDTRTGPDFRCGVGHAYKGGTSRHDSLFLDIFRIGVEDFRCITPEFFKTTEWFKYKDMHVRIPHPIEDYLLFLYGDTWEIPQPEREQWELFVSKVEPAARTQVKAVLNW